MNLSTANILVFHGSRDERAKIGINRLTQQVRKNLELVPIEAKKTRNKTILLEKPPLVKSACLELAQTSLSEKIYQIGSLDIKEVSIWPLFLSTGVHVQIDIPEAVTIATAMLSKPIEIKINPHLGENQGIIELIQREYQRLAGEGRILLAHGSKIAKANQDLEKIARSVGAIPAYKSVSPSLTTQVESLINQGICSISIFPYFLFWGKITDTLIAEIEELKTRFPHVYFDLGQPLGENSSLAKTIVNEISL